jgi:hypothetical protein
MHEISKGKLNSQPNTLTMHRGRADGITEKRGQLFGKPAAGCCRSADTSWKSINAGPSDERAWDGVVINIRGNMTRTVAELCRCSAEQDILESHSSMWMEERYRSCQRHCTVWMSEVRVLSRSYAFKSSADRHRHNVHDRKPTLANRQAQNRL